MYLYCVYTGCSNPFLNGLTFPILRWVQDESTHLGCHPGLYISEWRSPHLVAGVLKDAAFVGYHFQKVLLESPNRNCSCSESASVRTSARQDSCSKFGISQISDEEDVRRSAEHVGVAPGDGDAILLLWRQTRGDWGGGSSHLLSCIPVPTLRPPRMRLRPVAPLAKTPPKCSYHRDPQWSRERLSYI